MNNKDAKVITISNEGLKSKSNSFFSVAKATYRHSKKYILKRENQKTMLKLAGVISCSFIVGTYAARVISPVAGALKHGTTLYKEFQSTLPDLVKATNIFR